MRFMQAPKPRAKSAFKSSMCSKPTAKRIMPWVMPAARRWSSVKRPWVVLDGWVMVVLVSPRLAVIEHTCVLSITAKACAARHRHARP